MKILCDVCNKKEACVFCSADEAALCDVCDQRVHHANKLASKHERYSLLQPSSSTSSSQQTLCDICQEKRALLFCQQDRAILCRDCDVSLHTANEHTQKHNRFLLTGIKLSQMITKNTTITSKKDDMVIGYNNHKNKNKDDDNNSNIRDDLVPIFNPTTTNEPISEFSEKIPNLATITTHVTNNNTIDSIIDKNQLINGGSTSKISDYLIDMLPGWRFEDLLLDSASLPPLGFYKSGNNNNDFGVVNEDDNDDVMSFYDMETNKKLTSSSSTQFDNCWVPQAGPITEAGGISNVVFGHHHHQNSSDSTYYNYTSGLFHGTKQQQQQQQETSVMKFNNRNNLNDDDFFTVPEIPACVGSKRTRSYW